MEGTEVDRSRETHSLSIISEPPVSETRSRLIREWLVRFGTNHERAIAPLVALWEDELADVSPALLEKAFRQVLTTSRFFPTIADIRAQIDQANANGAKLEIEEAWARALDWVQRYFHPDLGVARGTPELPAAIQHALRAAGGMRWIETCPASELQWAKKRFVEDFTRVHETRQVEHLLTRPEARRILAGLTTAEPERQVRSGPKVEKSLPAKKPSSDEVREVLDRVTRGATPAAPPTVEPIEEELRERWEEQKRRLAEHMDTSRSTNPSAKESPSA
jgi:hypothetical protein